ncbi:hypothetical protein Amsp01_086040 [Amycolatopsis sp. NBRC 101858]|uniref:hypothetical protein n=1 Tax=Amycolatopsis sp. NBRC 101858 TaxID=3032200 RepID=UPI0024A5037E|nr:hypothetical protein [Amycolatopsis sp. NBRC 101858]GLY42581.1 hypothetical protein Amsp01_086040 [Amycolatopsis sp. NBRC 101858]
MKTRVDADWLPAPEKSAPEWSAHGTAALERRFRRLAAFLVLEILVAVACVVSGQVPLMVIGPAIAAYGGYCGFVADRRAQAARRTGWRSAVVTVAGLRSRADTSAAIAVRFADGSRIALRSWQAGFAVRALAERPDLPAIVAGHGPAMTVLVPPNPPARDNPVLFGARAETYRWQPDP